MTVTFSQSEQAFYNTVFTYPNLPDYLVDVADSQHGDLLDKINTGYYVKSDLTVSTDPRPNRYANYDVQNDKWLVSDKDLEPLLKDTKTAKIAEINAAKEAATVADILFHGVAYQTDQTAQIRILAVLGAKPEKVQWIASDNSVQTLALAELQALYNAVISRTSAIVLQATQDKAEVSSAKSLSVINKFTPDYSDISAKYDTKLAS